MKGVRFKGLNTVWFHLIWHCGKGKTMILPNVSMGRRTDYKGEWGKFWSDLNTLYLYYYIAVYVSKMQWSVYHQRWILLYVNYLNKSDSWKLLAGWFLFFYTHTHMHTCTCAWAHTHTCRTREKKKRKEREKEEKRLVWWKREKDFC